MTVKIGIIDYGMGNQGSIVNTLRSMDYKVSLARKPVQVKDKDLIILPGVGAFSRSNEKLEEKWICRFLATTRWFKASHWNLFGNATLN